MCGSSYYWVIDKVARAAFVIKRILIARRLDMKSKQIKNLLSEIESLSNNLTNYIRNSERDFLRNRKLSFFTIIKSIIWMESKSLTNELIDRFNTLDLLLVSSFIQQ